MNARRLFALCLAAGLFASANAHGHFLFIHVGPHAEGGRWAEVYFSDLAEAGDPRFVDKIAHTQLWVQKTPGKFEPLQVRKAADRLRAHLPASGSVVVVGTCQYGVLARPKEAPFLLRHYPKALAGNPQELAGMKPCDKVPLEIVATVEGEQLQLTALRDGKPVPKAEFTTIALDLTNVKLTADNEGRANWKPPSPGRYAIYTTATRKEGGQVEGKSYEEVREFATLAFSWPLERSDADVQAVALFQEALATRAQWQDFTGFTAHLAGNLDGRSFNGKVRIDARGAVSVDTDETAVQPWVQEQLESLVMHRAASREASSEQSRPVLRFAEVKDENPLGRLLIFDGGRFASSYRVKDRQIVVVNRHIGRLDMTITVLDNDKNAQGLFLPRSYTVQYWDAATGELQRTETVQDRWQRVGPWDLPARHTVTTASALGLAVRSFALSKHEVVKVR